jgi:uncharacterized protein
MVAFDPAESAAENVEAMRAAATEVRTGAVTRASATTAVGGVAVEEGDFLGLVGDEIVASGQVLDVVAREVLERLLAGEAALLTILVGEEAPDLDGLRGELAAAHPGLEISVEVGGQPHYPLLLAVE